MTMKYLQNRRSGFSAESRTLQVAGELPRSADDHYDARKFFRNLNARISPISCRKLTGMLAFSLAFCLSGPACPGQNTNSAPEVAAPILQKTSDLLCGIKKGVCFSDFRHGQHPDRGEGAVNPSDQEILQDLEILN